MLEIPNKMCLLAQKIVFIPRRSQKDIVFASSVRPSVRNFSCVSNHISVLICQIRCIVGINFSTMHSLYPISFVKNDPLTLELLSLS